MHRITFYPVGNADCVKLDISDGRKFLFDYANYYNEEDGTDLRINLPEALILDLNSKDRNYFDVVAFTHGDLDHINGSSEFFHFEYDKKYQSEKRVKIKELWVPAALLIEEGLEGEAKILQDESRFRLIEGKGIRVFSRPLRLKAWFEKEGIEIEDRMDLITDAGQLVPGFNKSTDGIEFFVHSPFAVHVDEGLEDRNESSLILHVTFEHGERETRFMIIGDTDHEILTEIVNITRYRKREDRLQWDIFDIPHHCSYLSLSSNKGKDKTEPVPEVEWLLSKGQTKGILVSSSNPIPSSDEDDQPPHREAARCYQEVADNIGGEFKVTMEHPSISNPQPLEITVDDWGATLKKVISGGPAAAISRPAPRAGLKHGIYIL